MKIRTITAILALPVLIIPLMLGGPYATLICLALSIIGSYELLKAFQIRNKGLIALSMIAIITYYAGIEYFKFIDFSKVLAFYLPALLILYVVSYPKIHIHDVAITLMTLFYPTFLISHIAFMRNYPSIGGVFMWLIFIIGFGSDTFAYLAGRTLGKKKLAAKVSPNKTVEGFIGGIIGAIALTTVYVFIMVSRNALIENYNIFFYIAMGGIGSVLSVFGDLAASAIKRQTGIKDFGNLLPGHGGILDRFDSNIFTAPFVYYMMVLWQNYLQ